MYNQSTPPTICARTSLSVTLQQYQPIIRTMNRLRFRLPIPATLKIYAPSRFRIPPPPANPQRTRTGSLHLSHSRVPYAEANR
ncbi:hypothetical protein K523DRAFT_154941 [Schizophyllum commune Tattone D]|nr:hypothetical protein K523DRAFT_154941 [Schizophyllum commune Tattone D]